MLLSSRLLGQQLQTRFPPSSSRCCPRLRRLSPAVHIILKLLRLPVPPLRPLWTLLHPTTPTFLFLFSHPAYPYPATYGMMTPAPTPYSMPPWPASAPAMYPTHAYPFRHTPETPPHRHHYSHHASVSPTRRHRRSGTESPNHHAPLQAPVINYPLINEWLPTLDNDPRNWYQEHFSIWLKYFSRESLFALYDASMTPDCLHQILGMSEGMAICLLRWAQKDVQVLQQAAVCAAHRPRH